MFQTPSFENILLSSSTAVESIDPGEFLRLPVEPSEGNYYEAGLTKVFFKKIKLDANYFRRLVSNYADDDQIDNTTISFPIAFQKAIIYGAEAKVDVPEWHRFSGFVSYSYTLGNAWFPVTGGLFLGDDAMNPTSGHFPDSQDQRNTVRGRVRYQVTPRFWIAGGIQYDTGLPFDFDERPGMHPCVAEYGQQVVNRINFARGRIYPSFQVNASAGADIYKSDRLNMKLQVDGENLNNVLWRDRLRRLIFRQRHRTAEELFASPHNELLGIFAISSDTRPTRRFLPDHFEHFLRGGAQRAVPTIHKVEFPRYSHLTDSQLPQIAIRHFPLHAHPRHDGDALLHFHEELDALDRRQFHAHL